MKTFQATFKRNGRETTMKVEAVNEGNARDIASYFQLSRGKLVKVEVAK